MSDLKPSMIFPGISQDPGVMGGAPVIEGTRITVTMLLDALAAGSTEAQIVEAYPSLTTTQVRYALGYATSVIRRLHREGNL